MATIILRPSADVSLGHSCSSGSNGYSLINESSADDNSTYIYQSISSTSSSSKTSTFKMSGTLSTSNKIKVTSVKVYVRAYENGNSDYTCSGKYKISVGSNSSSEAEMSNLTSQSSYTNYSTTYSASDLNISALNFSGLDDLNMTVTVSTSGNLTSTKGDSFNVRITQIYAEVTYEEVVSGGTGLYMKSNGSYVEVQKVYKKNNGIYVEQTDLKSLFSTSTKYKKGN
uniref:Uncharacterized protein n=1 Tax=Siphoviridae sp. ctg6c78 TaxID=2825603 RepID=A0A8S5URD3_9CAUD|nr:MAG TPA: hypothetical protein [Siphoviridae sp. ctg6c78]